MSRGQLRTELRRARRTIVGEQRAAAERIIRARVLSLVTVWRARNVALFIADDGEPSLAGVIDALDAASIPMALPGLAERRMDFRPYRRGDPMATGEFDMLEPATAERLLPAELDVVLTPLVGFDPEGNRIGRGAGFYDRAFGSLRDLAERPTLIGVGFEAQRVPSLPCEPHDVPLDAMVTEQGIRWFQ